MNMPEWQEYKQLVLAELERHGEEIGDLCKQHINNMNEIRDNITCIKVKLERIESNVKFHAKAWAFVAGLIPTLLIIAVELWGMK